LPISSEKMGSLVPSRLDFHWNTFHQGGLAFGCSGEGSTTRHGNLSGEAEPVRSLKPSASIASKKANKTSLMRSIGKPYPADLTPAPDLGGVLFETARTLFPVNLCQESRTTFTFCFRGSIQ